MGGLPENRAGGTLLWGVPIIRIIVSWCILVVPLFREMHIYCRVFEGNLEGLEACPAAEAGASTW